MTRVLLSVVVFDAIKRRYFAALKRLTADKALTPSQTVTLLADLDRLIGAYEQLAALIRQLDMAMDGRVHTREDTR